MGNAESPSTHKTLHTLLQTPHPQLQTLHSLSQTPRLSKPLPGPCETAARQNL